MERAPGLCGQTPEAAGHGPASGGPDDPRRVPADRRPSAASRRRTADGPLRRRQRGTRAGLAVGRHERAVEPDGRHGVRRPRVVGPDEPTERGVRHGRRAAQPDTVDTVRGARRLRLRAHQAHQPAALRGHIGKRTVSRFLYIYTVESR